MNLVLQIIKDELAGGQREVRQRSPHRDLRDGRGPRCRRPHRRRGHGRHDHKGRLRQAAPRGDLPPAEARRQGQGAASTSRRTTSSSTSSWPPRTTTCSSSRTEGKVYRLKVHELPVGSRHARGTAVINLLPFEPGRGDRRGHHDQRLQRRTSTCSSPHERPGEEDGAGGIRPLPPRRHHRHQPARRTTSSSPFAASRMGEKVVMVSSAGKAIKWR